MGLQHSRPLLLLVRGFSKLGLAPLKEIPFFPNLPLQITDPGAQTFLQLSIGRIFLTEQLFFLPKLGLQHSRPLLLLARGFSKLGLALLKEIISSLNQDFHILGPGHEPLFQILEGSIPLLQHLLFLPKLGLQACQRLLKIFPDLADPLHLCGSQRSRFLHEGLHLGDSFLHFGNSRGDLALGLLLLPLSRRLVSHEFFAGARQQVIVIDRECENKALAVRGLFTNLHSSA